MAIFIHKYSSSLHKDNSLTLYRVHGKNKDIKGLQHYRTVFPKVGGNAKMGGF